MLCSDLVIVRVFGIIIRNREQEIAPGHSVRFLLQKLSILLMDIVVGRIGIGKNDLLVRLGLR